MESEDERRASNSAMPDSGSHIKESANKSLFRREGTSRAKSGALNVSVEVTGLVPGVTDVGDIEQEGKGFGPDTEQARETAAEKPPSEVSVIVSVPAAPRGTVKLGLAGLTAKSGS